MYFTIFPTAPSLRIAKLERSYHPSTNHLTALYCTISATPLSPSLRFTSLSRQSTTVGYTKEDINSGNYNMISVPFNKVGTGGIKLDDIKVTNFATGTDWDECDWFMIWIPSTSTYDQFYYYDDGAGDEGWYVAGDGTYTDTFDSLYPDGLSAGQAMWFLPATKKASEARTMDMTNSGAVEDADDTGWVDLVANKYNMIANPYPVAWKLSSDTDYAMEGFLTGTDWDECDWFMIWQPSTSTYDQFYYYDDGAGDEGWYVAGDGTYTDTFDSLYPNGIPAGKPFWFLSATKVSSHPALKIKFFNPITK